MANVHHHAIVLVVVVLATTLVGNHQVSAEAPTTPTYFIEICRPAFGNYSANSTYSDNLITVLSELHSQASTHAFYNTSAGFGANKVYGQYYCRADITTELCSDCIAAAAVSLFRNCSNFRAAAMWFEECTLRYSNVSMHGVEAEMPQSWWYGVKNVSDPVSFSATLADTVDELINTAAHGDESMFATKEAEVASGDTLYSLAQCSPDMNSTQCETCLRATYNFIPKCCGRKSRWVFVFFPSCQLRYSTDQAFYQIASPPLPELPPPPPSHEALVTSTTPSSTTPSSTTIKGSGGSGGSAATLLSSNEGLKLGFFITTLASLMFIVNI